MEPFLKFGGSYGFKKERNENRPCQHNAECAINSGMKMTLYDKGQIRAGKDFPEEVIFETLFHRNVLSTLPSFSVLTLALEKLLL